MSVSWNNDLKRTLCVLGSSAAIIGYTVLSAQGGGTPEAVQGAALGLLSSGLFVNNIYSHVLSPEGKSFLTDCKTAYRRSKPLLKKVGWGVACTGLAAATAGAVVLANQVLGTGAAVAVASYAGSKIQPLYKSLFVEEQKFLSATEENATIFSLIAEKEEELKKLGKQSEELTGKIKEYGIFAPTLERSKENSEKLLALAQHRKRREKVDKKIRERSDEKTQLEEIVNKSPIEQRKNPLLLAALEKKGGIGKKKDKKGSSLFRSSHGIKKSHASKDHKSEKRSKRLIRNYRNQIALEKYDPEIAGYILCSWAEKGPKMREKIKESLEKMVKEKDITPASRDEILRELSREFNS